MASDDLKKNRKKVIFEPESQNLLRKSPNLNERLYKDILPLLKSFSFTLEELLLLKGQYDIISVKGFLTQDSFRQSLGLFGLENAPYLSDRIFSIISQNHDGQVNFFDYLSYLNILLNGTEDQKALQSFKIFDLSAAGILKYQDIEKMVLEICLLWNVMTGEKVSPTPNYINSIVKFFDQDNDGIISLDDYNNAFKNQELGVFGWYEFLNNGTTFSDNQKQSLIKPEKFNHNIEEFSKNIKAVSPKLNNHHRKTEILKNDLISSIETQIVEIIEEFQKEQDRLEIIMNKSESDSHKGPVLEISRFQSLSGENNEEFFPEEDFKDCSIYLLKKPGLGGFLNSDNASSTSFVNNDIASKSWEVEFLEESIRKLQNLNRQAELLKKSLTNLGRDSLTRFDIREKQMRRESEYPFSPNNLKENLTVRHKAQQNIPGGNAKILPKVETVRKSLSIYFGHPNWNLVLNMMIGIRASVRKKYRWDSAEIEDQDFKIKLELDLIDKRGEVFDKSKASKFYDYCPRVFEAIRKKFGITNDVYLRSMGPEQLLGDILMGNLSSLTQFCSSGKSGSLFYYSFDGKFILKTISLMEFLFLQKILKSYYEHLQKNEDSLLIRVFGLHKIKTFKSKTKIHKIYIITMQNLMNIDLRLDIKYDIKGSFYGRTAREQNVYWDKSIPLKDLDFLEDDMKILLKTKDKECFLSVLEKDCQFFTENNIIDYSLLIAIHFIPPTQQVHSKKEMLDNLNGNFADRCQRGLISGDENKKYILGVIDILTNYRYFFFFNKKLL